MAGRFVSVPMTLSDFERPDVRNQLFFRRILIMLVRSISHVIAFAQMRRAVCQRQLSFLLREMRCRKHNKPCAVQHSCWYTSQGSMLHTLIPLTVSCDVTQVQSYVIIAVHSHTCYILTAATPTHLDAVAL